MKWYDNFLQSGKDLKPTDLDYSRIRFINILGVIAIAIFTYYVVVNIQIKDWYPAFLELGFIVLLLISLSLLRIRKSPELSLQIGAFVVTAITIHNFGTGGFYATGNLWVYIFPPVIFLLRGFQRGLMWMFIVFIYMVVAGILQGLRVIDMPYSEYETWLTIISLGVISLILFIFVRGQEARSRLISTQAGDIAHATSDLTKANEELKKKDRERQKAMADLKKQKEISDKMNKLMVGREKKIIELKEKIKELEAK